MAISSTERFWNAEKQIGETAKLLVDLLDRHSRSKMNWYLFLMYGHGFIQDDDLEQFSEELRDWLRSSRELRK